MSISVTPSLPNTNVLAGQQTTALITLVNDTSDGSHTITGINVSEASGTVRFRQPDYLIPNVPIGTGNPTIAAGATLTVPFGFVAFSPNTSGPSPQAPGGGVGQLAFPARASFVLVVTVTVDSGTVLTGQLAFSAAASVAPFPVAQGGAFQHTQGANAASLLTTGML